MTTMNERLLETRVDLLRTNADLAMGRALLRSSPPFCTCLGKDDGGAATAAANRTFTRWRDSGVLGWDQPGWPDPVAGGLSRVCGAVRCFDAGRGPARKTRVWRAGDPVGVVRSRRWPV
jgi:hypothetical protein